MIFQIIFQEKNQNILLSFGVQTNNTMTSTFQHLLNAIIKGKKLIILLSFVLIILYINLIY